MDNQNTSSDTRVSANRRLESPLAEASTAERHGNMSLRSTQPVVVDARTHTSSASSNAYQATLATASAGSLQPHHAASQGPSRFSSENSQNTTHHSSGPPSPHGSIAGNYFSTVLSPASSAPGSPVAGSSGGAGANLNQPGERRSSDRRT